MEITPIFNRVFVEREIVDEKTKSGLFIPEQAREKPMRGKVIAVGPGKHLDNGTLRPVPVKVGDSVLYGKYAGSSVTVMGREILLLIDEDIFGIVEDEAA